MRFLIAVLLLTGAVSAQAQGLAEIAQAERARRAAMPSKARVVTNADLPLYPAAPRSEAILPFDVAQFVPKSTAPSYDGPRAYIDPYDRWWPFDGPPSSLAPPVRENITYVTYLGGYGYGGYGRSYRGQSSHRRGGASKWTSSRSR